MDKREFLKFCAEIWNVMEINDMDLLKEIIDSSIIKNVLSMMENLDIDQDLFCAQQKQNNEP